MPPNPFWNLVKLLGALSITIVVFAVRIVYGVIIYGILKLSAVIQLLLDYLESPNVANIFPAAAAGEDGALPGYIRGMAFGPVPLCRYPMEPLPNAPAGVHHPHNGGYYVVFRGTRAGIFMSWHEASRHCIGVEGAVHESYKRLADAHAAWEEALRLGNCGIIVLPVVVDHDYDV